MADYQFDCGCSFSVKDAKHPITLSQTGLPSVDFKISESPYNCKMTWDLIKEGKTKGVFQLESNLGKSWAKRIRSPNSVVKPEQELDVVVVSVILLLSLL